MYEPNKGAVQRRKSLRLDTYLFCSLGLFLLIHIMTHHVHVL